jgi:hypothetical protein
MGGVGLRVTLADEKETVLTRRIYWIVCTERLFNSAKMDYSERASVKQVPRTSGRPSSTSRRGGRRPASWKRCGVGQVEINLLNTK